MGAFLWNEINCRSPDTPRPGLRTQLNISGYWTKDSQNIWRRGGEGYSTSMYIYFESVCETTTQHTPQELSSQQCTSHSQTCQKSAPSPHPSTRTSNLSLPSQKPGLTVSGFSQVVNDDSFRLPPLSSSPLEPIPTPTGMDIEPAAIT